MSDPSTINGSAVLAMTGKECVAIISDKRFGVQYQTIGKEFDKLFRVHDKLFYGLGGLVTDLQTFSSKLKFRTNLYELKNKRTMEPQVLTKCISSMLYEKRFGPFFVQPVIAGLGQDNAPFIASMDSIGACTFPEDFVVAGTAEQNLFGICETLWRPDLSPDELKDVCSQCFLHGINRDALSGWGAVLYLITPDGVISEDIEARQD